MARKRYCIPAIVPGLPWLLTLTLVLAACEDSNPDYYNDIAPVMENSCVSCHQEGGIGPFALTSYQQVHAKRALVAGSAAARSMPPWHAEPGHQKYVGDPSLHASEITRIEAWAYGDALAGHAQGHSPATQAPGLENPDLVLALPEPYVPQKQPDDYRCFVIPWPETSEKYVTAFEVIPGRGDLVHHAIAYLTYPTGSSLATALDQAEEGPGYTCFGGPGQISKQDYDYGSLGGWAPGTRAKEYPAGTGIHVLPGASVVLQVHYYTAGGNTGPDATRLAFKLADKVAKPGTYMAWLNGLWVLPGFMPIPANTWTRQWIEGSPYLYWPSFSNSPVDGEEPFHIHSAMLHMHQRGVTSSTWIARQDGSKETLLEIKEWDFNWQREYFFQEPIRFVPGDNLGLECWFDNTVNSPAIKAGVIDKPTATEWGEGSADEMCVAFYYTTAD